ncbi:hypothetical protein PAMP_006463 [Pampus punctatissimus]
MDQCGEREGGRERWAGSGSALSHLGNLGNTNQVLQLLPPQLTAHLRLAEFRRQQLRAVNTSHVRPLTQRSACVPGLHGSRSSGQTIDSPPARSSSSSFVSSSRGAFECSCPGSPHHSPRDQMAGHEWEDWFEREEFIGQISDIRVQNLQGTRCVSLIFLLHWERPPTSRSRVDGTEPQPLGVIWRLEGMLTTKVELLLSCTNRISKKELRISCKSYCSSL